MITDGTLVYCVNAMLTQLPDSNQRFAIMVNLNDQVKFRLMSTPLADTGYVYPEDGNWFVLGLFDEATLENALQIYHMHYCANRVHAIFGKEQVGSSDLPK